MKPVRLAALALATALAPAVHAEEELAIAVRATHENHAMVCRWQLTNRGQRFINRIVIRQPRGGPWHVRSFDGGAPEGWFATDGAGDGRGTVWLPDEPDTALAPGETLELRLGFSERPGDAPFPCTELELAADGPLVRPAHVEKAQLTLSIGPLEARRIPAPAAARAKDRVEVRGSISLHNDGPVDTLLNLGMLLGNRQSLPTSVQLLLLDENGAEQPLSLDGMPSGIAGRIDALDVPLPAGATYSVAGPWLAYGLPPGKYRVVARYQGKNGGLLNSGMGLMRKWSGKVESAVAELVVP